MTPTPAAVFPNDLIPELLSFLPVNSLLRFQCVNKFWKTLISDPSFVKLHLKKSQTRRNPLFTLITSIVHADPIHDATSFDYTVVPYSLHRLIENPPFTLSVDRHYHVMNKGCSSIVGTCNGLVLLAGVSERIEYFRLWNPATRTISPYFGHFSSSHRYSPDPSITLIGGSYRFTFCCDDSTDTYKIVASGTRYGRQGTHVRILSLGHNVWRDIQSRLVVPLHLENDDVNVAVYLCSTVNWLAIIGDGYDLTVDQFVINSLDLKTETFNQYRLPTAFDQMPPVFPIVAALGDFLCFSYFYKETDYVIWQMKELGVEDSWTQFLKISLQNLQIDYDYFSDGEYSDDETMDQLQLAPLLLSEDADTLVLKSNQESHAILYNWRDNSVERTKITTGGQQRTEATLNPNMLCLEAIYLAQLGSNKNLCW